MRLDGAVFVRPAPKVPSMPTRRAFVIAGCTFAAGIAVGGACGYSAGVAVGAGSGRDPASDEIPKSGDAELDEFRRVAKGPLDELMAVHLPFVNHARSAYADDPVMWQGVGRIVDALIAGHPVENRRASARWIAQVIEQSKVEHAKPLLSSVQRLRNIR